MHRPQQRFFNPEEVRKVYPGADRPVKRGDREWVFQKDTFKDGYCERDVRIDHLTLDDVKPSLDEITKFAGNASTASALKKDEDGTGALSLDSAHPVDLQMLADAAKESSTTTLERDDAVEVFEGDLTGVEGTVQKINGNVVTILFSKADMNLVNQTAEVSSSSVRKRFRAGDHVKVTTGKHRDETGLVVKTEDNFTTFLSDLTMSEVTVFSKDLRQATEVGSGVNDIAGYELHNLVQLDAQTAGVIFKIERESFRVLDQLGNVLTVRPHQISMKRDTVRAVALDNEGSEFRAGDKMKEVEGEHREGQVLHIYQSVLVFMHNRDVADNGGVFISRARQLVPVAPKSTAFISNGASKGSTDLSKQNPQLTAGLDAAQLTGGGGAASSMRKTGRDPLQGKTVSIVKGPYKTYRGIIKDTNGMMARVELHTMSKILTIDIKSLIERDPLTGKAKPLMGVGSGPGFGGDRAPQTANPYASGPMRAANPYATPYASMGAATPYGASGGGKTPAHNPYDGSKTPAYGDGSRTPAYGAFDGGKTPAYGGFGGGKTPNPYAAMDASTPSGSKTPAHYGGYGGKTPNPYAGNDGSKTPHYAAPPPPRRYGDNNPYASAPTPYGGSAPTPYGSAPTPGGSGQAYTGAPTPGMYAGNPYAAPTPAAHQAGPGARAWGAPTPAGNGALAAPTPGAGSGAHYGATPGGFSAPTPWGGHANGASEGRPSAHLEGADKPLARTLIRITKDRASNASFEGGRLDRSVGTVVSTSANGESATIRMDAGETLQDVPTRFIAPQRPSGSGEVCLITMGEHRGKNAKVMSVDGNDFMVTLDSKEMVVVPPGALAKRA